MNEYIYAGNGKPLSNANGEISLARERITRCRDCKWISKDTKHYKACYRLLDCEFTVEPDGFCAWGEPREK